MIQVFLVEDEAPAMRKLERLVASQPDLAICGRATTCAGAIAGISETNPQLLILDIRLPDGTGFEVLQALNEPPGIQFIFMTAYDQYAVEAFQVAALDYLLKPVSEERFVKAIDRARERHARPDAPLPARYARRFLVERLKAAYLLPVESIHRITADRNYALIYSSMGEFALRTTMDALEQRLDPEEFARVSRSAIVRVSSISEVKSRGDQSYTLFLKTGEEVPCSKRYWTAALEKLL